MPFRQTFETWLVFSSLASGGLVGILAWHCHEATILTEELRLRLGELPQVVQGDPDCGCEPRCRCCECEINREE